MTTLLLVGRAHPRFHEKMKGRFELLELPDPRPENVTPDMAARVEGVTTFNHMPAGLMDALPNLKIVANFGVGYDGVDADHAARKGIIVSNTPDVLDEEVADTTIGLLLNTLRLLPQAENYLRAGRWAKEGAFRLSPLTLRGRHIGMYGMGRIGAQIARRLEAFNVEISYHTRTRRDDVVYPYLLSLKALAQAVDTLVCIVPKTPETRQTVNSEILAALGPSGVLINVDSVTGGAPQPYTSAYVASKYAVRALSSCLRMELQLERERDIHVCNVMPAAIDTPLFQHAANYTGRTPKALDPVYSPLKVARAIEALILKPRAEVVVGKAALLVLANARMAPRTYERTMARYVERNHLQDRPARATRGNLFATIEPKATVGGWREPSTITSKVRRGAWPAAFAGAAVLTALALAAAKRRVSRMEELND